MPIGTSDGQYFENVYDYYKRTSDAKEMAANETSGDFQSRFGAVETTPRMPPGASEKLTGALKQEGATRVAKDTPENGNRGVWDKLTGSDGGERYQLWPEKAIREIIEDVEAFGGKTPTWAMDPTTGEVRTDMQTAEKVFGAAGLAVFGPMPVAKKMVDGTLGSFAGVKSQTVSSQNMVRSDSLKGKLYEAQEMKMDGMHADEIWDKTGWFQGAEGKWRYEISDARMKLKDEAFTTETKKGGWTDTGNPGDTIKTIFATKGTRLDNVIEHPELFKAYPELKGVNVLEYPKEWNPEGKNLGMMSGNDLFIKGGQTPEMVKSIISHEVQHKIQDIEGFSRGANQNQFKSPKLTEAEEFFNKVKKQTEDEIAEKFGGDLKMVNQNKQWLKYELEYPEVYQALPEKNKSQALKDYESWKKSNPEDLKRLKDIVEAERLLKEEGIKRFDMYQKVRGEVEARNVQTRLNMETWEREAVPPYRTEDFGRDVQTASPWDKNP